MRCDKNGELLPSVSLWRSVWPAALILLFMLIWTAALLALMLGDMPL